MSQLTPNITTAGATLAKTYRKTQGGTMGQPKKRGRDFRGIKNGRKDSGPALEETQSDPEEGSSDLLSSREDLIERHARGFARDVAKRSKGVKKGRKPID